MLFDQTPKIIQRFEEYGYAKCEYRHGYRGAPKYKNVEDGDVFKVRRVSEKNNSYYLFFKGARGGFSAYYFKPITKKEFEKRKLMEVLQ